MRIKTDSLNVFQPLPIAPERPEPPKTPAEAPQATSRSFMNRLADAVRDVNTMQGAASEQAQLLATGEADSLQDVVVAVEKADLALQLTVQVTQKAIEAYKEISRMQV